MKFKHKVMSNMFDGEGQKYILKMYSNQSVLPLVPVLSKNYFNLFSVSLVEVETHWEIMRTTLLPVIQLLQKSAQYSWVSCYQNIKT